MKATIKFIVLSFLASIIANSSIRASEISGRVDFHPEPIQYGMTSEGFTASNNLYIYSASQDSLQKAKLINDFIKSYMDDYQIPGLAIAIVKDNQIYFAEAYGVKNLNTKEPMTTNTIFHMASVSKPFSATAIMQLVEQGKMKLDDPLVKYLPYFKMDDPRYKDITIKQMLTHTSGIPDVLDYEWEKPQYDDGAAERFVRGLYKEKLNSAPGEKWQYSNTAFDILGDVIAKVSGISFEDYIKEKILNPLDMNESNFLREKIKPELRTSAHIFNFKPIVSTVYPYNRAHAPSSCLNANVIELSNWAIANMNLGEFDGKRILNESSYKLLFEPQVSANRNQFIGLSWFIDQYQNMKTISHGGGDLGFRSYILMIPEKSLAVIIASNYSLTPTGDMAYGAMDIMLGFEPKKSKIPVFITLAKIILSDGVNSAIEQYREFKRSKPNTYDFSEGQLNTLGYLILNNKHIDDAIAIFKLNVEMYPQAFNTYDSLGEAYMNAGNKELAIENYEKSLRLNPDSKSGKDALKKLKE